MLGSTQTVPGSTVTHRRQREGVRCYSAEMLLLLLFIRTAIGIMAGVLTWVMLVQFGLVPAVILPMVAPFGSGFFGGLACMSLTPAQGLRIAATCGLILCVLMAVPINAGGSWNFWSLMVLPGYLSGASAWLAVARLIQNR